MMDNNNDGDEIITFPVPKRYLPVVIRALANAMEETSPPPVTGGPKGWTEEEIVQLKATLRNQTVRLLLHLTAAQPGEWIGFPLLCEKAGRTQRQVMGDLAGFTQLVKRRFGKIGGGQDIWPFEVEWGSPPEKPTRYRLPPSIAQWWQTATS
jgi:hypothetical protein